MQEIAIYSDVINHYYFLNKLWAIKIVIFATRASLICQSHPTKAFPHKFWNSFSHSGESPSKTSNISNKLNYQIQPFLEASSTMTRRMATANTSTTAMPLLGTFRMMYPKEKVSSSLLSRIISLAISEMGSPMGRARKNLVNTNSKEDFKMEKK